MTASILPKFLADLRGAGHHLAGFVTCTLHVLILLPGVLGLGLTAASGWLDKSLFAVQVLPVLLPGKRDAA